MSRVIFVEAGKVIVELLGSDSVAGSGPSGHTFTGQPLGVAGAGNLLVLLVSSFGTGNAIFSGVTFDGDAATEVVKIARTGNIVYTAGIYQIQNKSGTGDIALSLGSGTGAEFHVHIIQLRGVRSAIASDTDSDAPIGLSTTTSTSLDVPARGVCLALAYGALSSDTISWSSNISELNAEDDGISKSSVAAQVFDVAQSPLSLTATFTIASPTRSVAASWR